MARSVTGWRSAETISNDVLTSGFHIDATVIVALPGVFVVLNAEAFAVATLLLLVE